MSDSKCRVYLTHVFAAFCVAGLLAGTSSAGFSIADKRELRTVSSAIIAPDGERIAYVVREPDTKADRYVSDLWLVDWSGRDARQLVKQSTVALPVWSPDGERIAFVSDRDGDLKIWTVSANTGRLTAVTGRADTHGKISTHRVYASLRWSPDSRKIAFVAHDTVEQKDPYVWKKWFSESGFGQIRNRVQIWTVDVGNGEVVQLTDGDFHHGEPVWSPDGSTIAFTANRLGHQEAIASSINENYDIWTVPSNGGELTQLTNNEGPDSRPVWSPDGKSIAYVSASYYGSHSDVKHLLITDIQTRETRAITDAKSFDYSVQLSPGSWAGSDIFFTAGVGVTTQAFRVSPKSSGTKPERIVPGQNVVSSLSVSADGARMAYVLEDTSNPPEVWRSRTSGKQGRVLTDAGAELRSNGLATAEVIRWRSSDGMEIEGILIKPEDHDRERRYPLVVAPHGGPHGASMLRFSDQDQVYADAGYLVFHPNFRGSTGYGQRFIDADRGDFGGGDYRDVMTGVDYLIDQQLVDPDRLLIAGWSYGGFMTAWTVGQTDRFKAAVAGAPPTNAQTFFALSDIPHWITWEFYGYPWERPDLHRANSPITYVQNVTTPTMVMHGERDIRVPLSEGLQFYNSLEALGVPTQMVIYPGAAHGLSKPSHQIHRLEMTLAWFARYLDES